jgi:hypothetical protein
MFPSYYRALFRESKEPQFHPAEVGMAMGLPQGLVFGVCLSLALVLILVWRERRSLSQAMVEHSEDEIAEIRAALRGLQQPSPDKAAKIESSGFRPAAPR